MGQETWEEEYENILTQKSLNISDDRGVEICDWMCSFQFNTNNTNNKETNLQVKTDINNEDNLGVLLINVSSGHELTYNGGVENESEHIVYTLQNIFIKLVSENSFNMEKSDMNLFLLYKSNNHETVIISVLIDAVDDSELDEDLMSTTIFNKISDQFPKSNKVGKKYQKIDGITNWKIVDILPPTKNGKRDFYKYNTSKSVGWIAFKDHLKVSNDFYDNFIKNIPGNTAKVESTISKRMKSIPKNKMSIDVYGGKYNETAKIVEDEEEYEKEKENGDSDGGNDGGSNDKGDRGDKSDNDRFDSWFVKTFPFMYDYSLYIFIAFIIINIILCIIYASNKKGDPNFLEKLKNNYFILLLTVIYILLFFTYYFIFNDQYLGFINIVTVSLWIILCIYYLINYFQNNSSSRRSSCPSTTKQTD